MIAASISSVAVVMSAAASFMDCTEAAVLSMNSSAVLVMQTDELRKLSVVSWRSVMVVTSCSVVGRRSSVTVSAILEAVLSILSFSRISTTALSPSTNTFDKDVVWDRCSKAMLRLRVSYSSPSMTRHLLSKNSFAIFTSCTELMVALSSSSHDLPAEGFKSLLVLPHVPGLLGGPEEGAIR